MICRVFLVDPGDSMARTAAACAFRQAPLRAAARAHELKYAPRAPRPNARLTNPQIAAMRGKANLERFHCP